MKPLILSKTSAYSTKLFARGASLEEVESYITLISKRVAYLFGYPGSLDILERVGPVLVETSATLGCGSQPGTASLFLAGAQGRWPAASPAHRPPCPTSSSTRARAAPQTARQTLRMSVPARIHPRCQERGQTGEEERDRGQEKIILPVQRILCRNEMGV